MHRRAHCKTSPSHRSIRSTREDRTHLNMSDSQISNIRTKYNYISVHQIPEDADGVVDTDCADVPNGQPETVTATSAI